MLSIIGGLGHNYMHIFSTNFIIIKNGTFPIHKLNIGDKSFNFDNSSKISICQSRRNNQYENWRSSMNQSVFMSKFCLHFL